MQYTTSDVITAILYTLTGVFALAISAMVVHAYNRIMKTQDAFLQALSDIRLEQVDQNNKIKNNHEHLVRLERVQTTHAEDLADKIITKLRAVSGGNHVGNINGNGL